MSKLTLFLTNIPESHHALFCFLPRTAERLGEVLGVMDNQSLMDEVLGLGRLDHYGDHAVGAHMTVKKDQYRHLQKAYIDVPYGRW